MGGGHGGGQEFEGRPEACGGIQLEEDAGASLGRSRGHWEALGRDPRCPGRAPGWLGTAGSPQSPVAAVYWSQSGETQGSLGVAGDHWEALNGYWEVLGGTGKEAQVCRESHEPPVPSCRKTLVPVWEGAGGPWGVLGVTGTYWCAGPETRQPAAGWGRAPQAGGLRAGPSAGPPPRAPLQPPGGHQVPDQHPWVPHTPPSTHGATPTLVTHPPHLVVL